MRPRTSAVDRFLLLTVLCTCAVVTFGLFSPFDGGNITPNFLRNPDVRREALREIQRRGPWPGEQFALSSIYQDEIAYLDMAVGEPTYAPYRFRVLVPALVRGLVAVERALLEPLAPPGTALRAWLDAKYALAGFTFWWLNFALLIVCVGLQDRVVRRATDDRLLRFAVAMLFATHYAVLKTASFPMLDLAAFAFTIGGLELLLAGQLAALAMVLVAAVATKEVALVWSPALAALWTRSRDARLLAVAMAPVLAFAGLRAALGASPLNVQYDWDLLEGEVGLHYLRFHLATNAGFIDQLVGMFFGWSFLWIYLPRASALDARVMPGLSRFFWAFTLSLLAAQLLLSDRVARVLALGFPLFALLAAAHLGAARDAGAAALRAAPRERGAQTSSTS